MKYLKFPLLFCAGGTGYMTIELLWRGWSHGSMFLAGGTCFLLLGQLQRIKIPLPLRALLGAGVITGVELAAGLLFNRSYTVWDYRRQPGNLWGQICPAFTALWIPVAMMAIYLYDYLEAGLEAKMSPG